MFVSHVQHVKHFRCQGGRQTPTGVWQALLQKKNKMLEEALQLALKAQEKAGVGDTVFPKNQLAPAVAGNLRSFLLWFWCCFQAMDALIQENHPKPFI